MTRTASQRLHQFRLQRGFTLIELLVCVVIVGLLASVTVPVGEVVVRRSREHDLREALREIRIGIDRYKRAYDEGRIARNLLASGYPPNLNALVEGVPDNRDPNAKARLYFLRRIPSDPMQDAAGPEGATSWGLRSFASPPDAPAEGDDVFDVYSRSSGMGLNGIPYRQW